jgi:lysophospholipase L1-like esterase
MKWRNQRNRITSWQLAVGNVVGNKIACLVLIFICFTRSNAQDSLSVASDTLGLAIDSINVIQNAEHLDDFYETLFKLEKGQQQVVSVIHLGDSHIQADFLTHTVRKSFQERFGNAGRGLVVPGTVAGTHDAFNVVSSSPLKWKSKRCIYPDQPLPIGIGGITINSDAASARFDVAMKDLWIDHSFNTLTLFFQKDISSFHFSVKDTANQSLAYIGAFTQEEFQNYSRVVLPYSVGSVTLETIRSTPQQVQATIFGLSLENGKRGVLYHAIGVNGAKYSHYNEALLFARQTSALKPSLIIVALGTNESLDYPNLDKNFSQHIDKLVNSLKSNNPQAKFVLVTPQETFRRRTRANPNSVKIRDQIVQYAIENGFAFWDMYKIVGGEGSAEAWKKSTLLRSDGVHLSRQGYEYEGSLLFEALMKSYNKYVQLRHP